jgi:excisionase family DNA binding protein
MMVSVPSEDDLLTIPEAAATLKVSPVTISRWLKQGRLTAYRLGPRAVRIRRDDLVEVLKPSGHGGSTKAEAEAETDHATETENGYVYGNGNGNGALRLAASRSPVSLAALREAAGLRERILTRRKGVLLPTPDGERGKEKRGKRT